MSISIRPMTPADHNIVQEVARTLALWWQPIDQMTLAADLRDHHGIVAEDEEGEIVGFLTYRFDKPRIAEITWLGVEIHQQARGIGTALLDYFENLLADEDVDAIELSTVPPDHEDAFISTNAFYARHGYRPIRRENHFYAFGRPRVLLRKQLT